MERQQKTWYNFADFTVFDLNIIASFFYFACPLGEGELVEANGDIYKGSFYQHKKHGKGHQIYRLTIHVLLYIVYKLSNL